MLNILCGVIYDVVCLQLKVKCVKGRGVQKLSSL